MGLESLVGSRVMNYADRSPRMDSSNLAAEATLGVWKASLEHRSASPHLPFARIANEHVRAFLWRYGNNTV